MSTEEFHFLRRFPLLFEDLSLLETYSNSVPHSSAVNSGLNIHNSNKSTPLGLSIKEHKELRHTYLVAYRL